MKLQRELTKGDKLTMRVANGTFECVVSDVDIIDGKVLYSFKLPDNRLVIKEHGQVNYLNDKVK